MFLQRLELHNVRIIEHAYLRPCPGINLVQGINGAGKTSLLEAIYLLSTGRSFRTRRLERLVNREDKGVLSVFGVVADRRSEMSSFLGVERGSGGTRLKVNGEFVKNTRKLAERLSVLTLTPESHRLFSQGPGQRRAMMDWAVFHVEQRFVSEIRGYSKALLQRNAALRQGAARRVVTAWDLEIEEASLAIHRWRKEYVATVSRTVSEMSERMLGTAVTLEYRKGWSGDLRSVLKERYSKDLERGYTGVGCHRADLRFKIEDRDVEGFLSHGQSKLLTAVLTLSQCRYLTEQTGKSAVVLVDDFTSELSSCSQAMLVAELETLGCQTFLTTPNEHFSIGNQKNWRMFHVERGHIMDMV